MSRGVGMRRDRVEGAMALKIYMVRWSEEVMCMEIGDIMYVARSK